MKKKDITLPNIKTNDEVLKAMADIQEFYKLYLGFMDELFKWIMDHMSFCDDDSKTLAQTSAVHQIRELIIKLSGEDPEEG